MIVFIKAKSLEMDEFLLDKVAEFVQHILCFVFMFIFLFTRGLSLSKNILEMFKISSQNCPNRQNYKVIHTYRFLFIFLLSKICNER